MRNLAAPQKQFFWALLISSGLHIFMISALPGLSMGDFALPESYTEIKLVYIPPKPIEKISKVENAQPKKKSPLPKQGDFLTEQANKLSALQKFRGTIPPIQLPGEVSEKELAGLLPEVSFPVDEIVLPASLPQSVPEVQLEKRSSDSGMQAGKPLSLPSQMRIEWAGPPRRPLHQPPSPKYSSKIEGEVRLKFWVDPAGKVSNVVVLRKLDADLERISLQYMKQWLFEPLLPNAEQSVQWGTITIRFRRD